MGQVIGRTISRAVEDALDTLPKGQGISINAVYRIVMQHKVITKRVSSLMGFDQLDNGESAEMLGRTVRSMVMQRFRYEADVILGFKIRRLVPVRQPDRSSLWFRYQDISPSDLKETSNRNQSHARSIDRPWALYFDWGEWAEDRGRKTLGDTAEAYLRERIVQVVPLLTLVQVRSRRVAWAGNSPVPIARLTGHQINDVLTEYEVNHRADGTRAKALYRIREEYRVRNAGFDQTVEALLA